LKPKEGMRPPRPAMSPLKPNAGVPGALF
jgi:hypothetical protein